MSAFVATTSMPTIQMGAATFVDVIDTWKPSQRRNKPPTLPNTMDFKDYETAAARTFRPEDAQAKTLTPQQTTLLLGAMGMAGEAGEFLDHVKKHLFHDQELTEERVAKMKAELGDILWYHFTSCSGMGTTMSEMAQGNIDKLLARHPNGVDFSYHDKQVKANEKAAILAMEGRIYNDLPRRCYVFISSDYQHRFDISEQEITTESNFGYSSEAIVRNIVMHRLIDVFQAE